MYFLIFIFFSVFFDGCSHESITYDELDETGKIEPMVQKKYADFFKSIKSLGDLYVTSPNAEPDSTILKKPSVLTDQLIDDMRPFPSTVPSRIALDGLSYAAHDLTEFSGFSRGEVFVFWRDALLDPIFTIGREYMKSGKNNESTHLQIVKALKRGIGSRINDTILIDLISIVGPAPSKRIMELCRSDSLAFKKIFDLIMYTRSLQEMGPPLWMITGSWFLLVNVSGWPSSFFCLKSLLIDDVMYLTFRDYNIGEVYAAVFDDPIPDDSSRMDAWLARAEGVMNNLRIDDTFAKMVSRSNLPTYDTHNYYNDYLLITKADSIKKEYRIILKRDREQQGAFEFVGADSIEVLFTESEILAPPDNKTPLFATRYQGASMVRGNYTPNQIREGEAYLMPLGVHDEQILNELKKLLIPEITVSTP